MFLSKIKLPKYALSVTLAFFPAAQVFAADASSQIQRGTTPSASPSASPSVTPSATPNVSSTSTIGLASKTLSMGTYVFDSLGKTVYVFSPDSLNTSTCTGSCATAWPPVPSIAMGGNVQVAPNAAPQSPQSVSGLAGSGVNMSLIGAMARSDGTQQATYNGLPLYYYVGDVQPHQINGQDINSFGGVWYLISPNGGFVTSPASSG